MINSENFDSNIRFIKSISASETLSYIRKNNEVMSSELFEVLMSVILEMYPRGHNFYREYYLYYLKDNDAIGNYLRLSLYISVAGKKSDAKLISEHLRLRDELIFKGVKSEVSFTYDDGRLNNYTKALPLHEKYNVSASFFIITSRMYGDKFKGKYLSSKQVKDSFDRGVEIGSHTVSHNGVRLTEMDDNQLEAEIIKSKECLADLLGCSVDSIAIPYSKHDERVLSKSLLSYKNVRVAGSKLMQLGHTGVIHSYPVGNLTTLHSIYKLVSLALKESKKIVFRLHGVHDDTLGKHDCTPKTLSSILSFISEVGEELLSDVGLNGKKSCFSQTGEKVGFDKKANSNTSSFTYITKVLDSTDLYKVTAHINNASDKVILGFGGLPSGIDSPGFGRNLFLKNGYSYINVAQKALSQYQGLNAFKLKEIISDVIKDKEIFCYGSSLGGYAALYYGGVLDAQIIAAAPKNSAHPKTKKSKFKDTEWLHEELDSIPVSTKSPIVIFDPFRDEEANYINKFVRRAYSEAEFVLLPFWGHTVLNTMKEGGQVSDFILNIISDNKIIDLELSKNASYIFNAEKANYLVKLGNIRQAIELYEASIAQRLHIDAVKGLLDCYKNVSDRKSFDDLLIKIGNESDIDISNLGKLSKFSL